MTSARPRWHYGWIMLVLGMLVTFGALGLARFGYTVVLPAMQTGLNMQNTQAGAVATANLAGYLALALIGGALASHFGPRAVITAGLTVAGLGMIITGLSHSVALAAFGRLLTGLGSGASNVPAVGLMAAWFAPNRRGMASGIVVAGSSVAMIIIGPLSAHILGASADVGWRICWFVFGGTALLIATVGWLFLRNHPSEKNLAPVGAAPDAVASNPTKTKLDWGAVYRSPQMWRLGLVYMANGFSYIIYMTFFTKALITDGGYTREGAGNMFMMMGWFSLFCGIIWGTLSDVIGRKRALMIVYLLHAAAFGLFALCPVPAGFTVSVALFGITAWSIPAIMGAACGDILGSRLAPAGLGFITLLFGIAQAVGPSVAGAVADRAQGSLLPAMLLAAIVALVGAVGTGWLPRDTHRAQTTPDLLPTPGK